jgi:hypothetical protein
VRSTSRLRRGLMARRPCRSSCVSRQCRSSKTKPDQLYHRPIKYEQIKKIWWPQFDNSLTFLQCLTLIWNFLAVRIRKRYKSKMTNINYTLYTPPPHEPMQDDNLKQIKKFYLYYCNCLDSWLLVSSCTAKLFYLDSAPDKESAVWIFCELEIRRLAFHGSDVPGVILHPRVDVIRIRSGVEDAAKRRRVLSDWRTLWRTDYFIDK